MTAKLTQSPIEEEYKKTGISPEDIAGLRLWLETQPHLPSKHITDLDLILALHACERSTGVTKQVIDLHFTLRTLFTAFFKDRQFDDRVQKCLETVLMTPLPTRTKEGYAVFYTHLLDTDLKHFDYGFTLRCVLMVLDIWQYCEGTCPGIVIVVDYEGVSMGHIARFDIQNTQQFLYYLQEAMLVKLKGIHFINAPSFIDRLMLIVKPFLKKEILETFMVQTTGNVSLESIAPLEALPKESGGEYKSYRECRDDVIAMVRAADSYLENDNLKRVTESLRPGKPKTMSDIFGGVVGSFKKLDID